MELIIDATALLSVFIAKGSTPNIIFIEGVEWLAPAKLKEEFIKHIDEIIPRSSLSEYDAKELIELAFSKIGIIKAESFNKFRKEAKSLVSDPDDTEYFALSLSRNKIPIWSNDPHFKEQSVVRVFKTGELIEYLKSLGLY